ncbi:hypothetical protein RICGR_0366 [Rickettsiella grylli]|uniref:Uncharacterized protein n=1 Tax=Rickettsiella grylli TaxID=59196 RepID=A8PL98_9COXI|nr:hypothetical protein RICGR_0366 [Rickettsiella grylli]
MRMNELIANNQVFDDSKNVLYNLQKITSIKQHQRLSSAISMSFNRNSQVCLW